MDEVIVHESREDSNQSIFDALGLETSEILDDSLNEFTTIDEAVEQIKREAFQGLITLMKKDGTLVYANGRMRLINGMENTKMRKCFIDYVSLGHRKGIRILMQKLCTRETPNKEFRIKLPLEIQRQEIIFHANIIAFKEFLVLKIADELLVQIVEIEIERLKALILECPEKGLWITDENGIIIDLVETNMLHNLGHTKDDLIGKSIFNYVFTADRLRAMDPRGESNERVYQYNIRRLDNSGAIKMCQVTEGDITLSDGRKRKIFVDSYPMHLN